MKYRRLISVLLSVILTAVLIIPVSLPVSAANKRFITELRVAAGEDAAAALEEDGWSVTMVGLNITTDSASQVYLAYKLNTGTPLTNVIVSPDVGDTCKDKDGIVYKCMSHVDLDEGLSGKAGCIYATTDERAGDPLVGIDVLRSNSAEGGILYPITNDGAEIVRTPEGAPADVEPSSESDVVYLAQIRDGIVRPYIREIGVVTDTDKWNAVYTAAERGYNYYVDGDLDESTETYTLVCYERTADPADAVTGINALTEKTVKTLESGQIIDEASEQSERVTAAAVSISDAEYVRISGKPVSGSEPYYIYRSKDPKAGNPISMLYVEKAEESQNFLFGTWANEYFFSRGATTAYSYCINEDIYNSLWDDQTVCIKLPVRLLSSISANGYSTDTDYSYIEPSDYESGADMTSTFSEEASQNGTSETTNAPSEEASQNDTSETTNAPSEEASQNGTSETTNAPADETTSTPAEENTAASDISDDSSGQQSSNDVSALAQDEPESQAEPESQEESVTSAAESADTVRYINLSVLTPRDGLPDTAITINGMRGDPFNPYIERTERSDRVNKFQASVFSSPNIITPILGGVVLLTALGVFLFKRHSKKKALAAEGQTNAPGRAKKSKKSGKSKKSRKSR